MRLHFIGIAGTGMGALARLLREAGHEVRGSDAAIYPPMSEQLAQAGIPVMLGFAPTNLAWGPDAVVVGNVCSKDHPEVIAAQAASLPLESFPSMLARALLPGRDSLVVAGTHGKTTTTSLVAWILRVAGRDPSFLVGGVPLNFGTGAHLGKGKALVLEGDEYDTAFFDKGSKFLHYAPKRAVLTNVEHDHADIFAGIEQVRAAFLAFVRTLHRAGDLIVNLDDSEAMGVAAGATCNIVTYRVLADANGDVRSADYCAAQLGRRAARCTDFEVFEHGESLGRFTTQLIGTFNLANVLAAIALCRREGIDPDTLRRAVRSFRGVKRRQELVGIAHGVRVLSDFAHHPTAVSLVATALRKHYHDNALHVCFEPRSASSRRRKFAEAYATAFDAATAVYIGPLWQPEKIPEDERLDTHALARTIGARGVKARAFDDVPALAAAVLDAAVPGDTVLLLSSGSFGGLPDQLLFGFGDPVTFADEADRSEIDALMGKYGLPPVILSDDVEAMVMRSPAGITGTVNLQIAGEVGFLFGLAVQPDRRGGGLGWVLGDCVLRRARALGLRKVYLLTNTAADFFAAKLGFSQLDEDDVESDLRTSANFRAAAEQAGAVCMKLDLPG